MSELIRVWREFDLKDVSEHLLIVGLSSGDCSKCRELGIDYSKAKVCPKCGTDFKYIGARTKETKRIIVKRPDLVFIDFEDYKKASDKIRARDLLS